MNLSLIDLAALAVSPFSLWVDMLVKATFLLVFGWVCALCLRRSSAAVRHQVWCLTLCGLIVLPVATWFLPGWRLAIPISSRTTAPQAAIAAEERVPAAPAIEASAVRSGSSVALNSAKPLREVDVAAPKNGAKGVLPASPLVERIAPTETANPVLSRPWNWAFLVFTVWGLGFLCVLLPTLVGLLVNPWQRRRLRLIDDGEWSGLLNSIRRAFAIRRVVELRQSDWPIPATSGLLRPMVMLPVDASEWTESTRRVVLLHELAHIRRFDVGVQTLGRLACAVFWFHPLAWYALHRLRFECEHACDDCVLQAGERPTDYASQLLNLARSVRLTRFSPALAMARTNTLEVRMKAIFDETCQHLPMGRWFGRLMASGAAVLVLLLASVQPTLRSAVVDEPKAEEKAKPKGSGRITGKAVMADSGAAMAGAEIVLLDPPPKGQDVYIGKLPLRKAIAAADGSFAFENLPAGRYRAWANSGRLTSRKGARDAQVVVVPEAGEMPKPVVLKLAPAVLVTVRVKEKATGNPIPGATVALGWSDFPEDAKTDRNGVALIQPLTRDKWLLNAFADGFVKNSKWMNLENGADAEVEFSLAPGGDLTGTVRDPSGKPVEGVGLSASAEGVHEQLEYVKTDKEGRYRLAHLPLETAVTIDISKEDFLRTSVTSQAAETVRKLDLKIEPRPHGGSVVGVVLDPNGKPVAGAELHNEGNSSNLVREVKSGPDGRFRIDDVYENHLGKEVLIRARGFAPKRVKIETGPAENPNNVEIKLEAGHRIKGRVVDETGRPVEGVWVYFADAIHAHSIGDRTITDKEGNFTFDSLPLETPFTFQKKGFSQINDRPLPLDGDDVVKVEMISAGVIVGKVRDAKSGEPIHSFKVQLTFSPIRQQGDPTTTLLASWSNPGENYQSDHGEFRFGDLVVGMPLQVTVSADGYERHVAQRIVAARADSAASEGFALVPVDPRTLCAYRGRLVFEDGKPVVGAQLRLIAAKARGHSLVEFPFGWQMIRTGQAAQQAMVSRFVESTTDKDGRFSFKNIPKDDQVELVWWGNNIASGRADQLGLREEKEKEPLEIKIPTPGKITGVLDRAAFGPVAQVHVSPTDQVREETILRLKPDQTEFEIGNLAPGEYHVQLYSPFERVPGTNGGLTNKVVAQGKVTVDAGGSSRIEFR